MIASEAVLSEVAEGICALTFEQLDVTNLVAKAQDDAAGAVAVFVGKLVTRLEYQAYSKVAIKTMRDIIQHQGEWADPGQGNDSPIIRSIVYHRLGVVPVGEASIVVAVSSPHRKEAFVECEWILEQVKKKAQIWKREFYEGEDEETAQWKANH